MSAAAEKQVVTIPQSNVLAETTAIMTVIERVATNPDADIAKLEKMLDMQERILDRNARMEFDAALAAMQPELPEVEKTATGHNSKYAKFEHILASIKPSLTRHGFSITHRVRVDDNKVFITGILSHKGGHREETTLTLPPDKSGGKNEVQAIASSTEYGRRYTMNSLLGIATKDADVDGGKPQETAVISEDQLAELITAMSAKGITTEAFCKKMRIGQVAELESVRFPLAMGMIEKTKGKADADN